MVAPTVPARRSLTSLRMSFIANHPLLSYFGIAFTTVWVALLPFVLAKNGLGLINVTLPDWAFIVLFIGGTVAGPTLGAFSVTAVVEGKRGVRQLLRRYVQWRTPFRWYAIALFGYLVLHLIAATIWLGTAPLFTFVVQWRLLFSSYLPSLVAMILFPALIEEGGWRGFALPRLQARYGPLIGTLILGFLHGLWHLPVYTLVSGPAAMGPFNIVSVIANTISIMAIAIIWTWVVNHAHGSILMAILLHAASNATGQFFPSLFTTLPSQVEVTMFGLYITCAILIVVATRGQLGYAPKEAQPTVEVAAAEIGGVA